MNTRRVVRLLVLCVFVVSLAVTEASAQIARVFLSGTGSDAGDCSNAATPCRSLQGAIDQSVAGGEVIVMTSGGYGAANITKSITVNSPSGVVAFNARTITVNIAPADKVVLRGLSLNGAIFGDTYGINFVAGGTLVIENSLVSGFGYGIQHSAGNSKLIVNNCEVRNNSQVGINSGNIFGTPQQLVVENCRLTGNNGGGGLHIHAGSGVVRNTVAASNGFGFSVLGNSGNVYLTLDTCVTANNGVGVRNAQYNQGAAIARVTNTTITGNTVGLEFLAGTGSIISYGTNQLWNNTSTAAFSSVSSRD